MAALRDEMKRFVVQALACYDTPTQVSIAIKHEYGLNVGRLQVAAYDPTKHAGRSLSQKWAVLFNDTREKFRETTAMIPIAQQSFRLRALELCFSGKRTGQGKRKWARARARICISGGCVFIAAVSVSRHAGFRLIRVIFLRICVWGIRAENFVCRDCDDVGAKRVRAIR